MIRYSRTTDCMDAVDARSFQAPRTVIGPSCRIRLLHASCSSRLRARAPGVRMGQKLNSMSTHAVPYLRFLRQSELLTGRYLKASFA